MTRDVEHGLHVLADAFDAQAERMEEPNKALLHAEARVRRAAAVQLQEEREEREAKVKPQPGQPVYDPRKKR